MNYKRFDFLKFLLGLILFTLFYSCSADQVVKFIPIEKKGILYKTKNDYTSLVICQKENTFYINGEDIGRELSRARMVKELNSLNLPKIGKGVILTFINWDVEYENYLKTYNLLVDVKADFLNRLSISRFNKNYADLSRMEKNDLKVFITINDSDINDFSSEKEKSFCF